MSDKSLKIIKECAYKPISVIFVDENGNHHSPIKVILELENKDETEE